MQESDLKEFARALAPRLLKRNSDLPSAADRIAFLLGQPETEELSRLMSGTTSANGKSADVARQNRDDGNAAFQSGDFNLALLLYSESMRYAPVDLDTLVGEDMAAAAANRSAALFQLGRFEHCLQDIHLALEAGYATIGHGLHKLYVRQCKCLLELGRIASAQKTFDQAVDAIDRSGISKELRQGLATELQEAFITLARENPEEEEEEDDDRELEAKRLLPPWAKVKQPHPNMYGASAAVRVEYHPDFGRHIVAEKQIEAGDVVFVEEPLVSFLETEFDASSHESCHECFGRIGGDDRTGRAPLVPSPGCSGIVFCSLRCRRRAWAAHHKYECRAQSIFKGTKLDDKCLVTMSFRAVAQKPAEFFLENSEGIFADADDQYWSEEGGGLSEEQTRYRSLFCLVTHEERRQDIDVATKAVFAVFLLKCLEVAGYFTNVAQDRRSRAMEVVGRVLLQFLMGFQFNTHMIEGVYSNRLISTHDAETRIWKEARKFTLKEFVENVRLGGGVYPTMANLNHSCDPNLLMVNFGRLAVVVANRTIRAGEQLFDTYGANYGHMERDERRRFLQASYWFECGCVACKGNWPTIDKLPREYLKLPGSQFRYKRCNRRELQKDIDRLRKRIQHLIQARPDGGKRPPSAAADGAEAKAEQRPDYEEARALLNQWIRLLDELILPPHQDFAVVRKGMRNCVWMQSEHNLCQAREDEELQAKKERAKIERKRK